MYGFNGMGAIMVGSSNPRSPLSVALVPWQSEPLTLAQNWCRIAKWDPMFFIQLKNHYGVDISSLGFSIKSVQFGATITNIRLRTCGMIEVGIGSVTGGSISNPFVIGWQAVVDGNPAAATFVANKIKGWIQLGLISSAYSLGLHLQSVAPIQFRRGTSGFGGCYC